MKEITIEAFENILDKLCRSLTKECTAGYAFPNSNQFEGRVREVLQGLVTKFGLRVDFDPHPYQFPDIVLGKFGIEVKYTTGDTWRSVANSVFESTRSQKVNYIYIVFGKMGGKPAVDWDRYDECVIHVRTSHVPRFEVELHPKKSLFAKMGISYQEFSQLLPRERMEHVRKYARRRLKEGEKLWFWWLEDRPDEGHSLPPQARLYMTLAQDEKRQLRAEAALLCPQIVKPSRSKHKYDDAVLYLLTYHGVLCSQARDLFSAGSVAMRANQTRGGNYVLRALLDIQNEMQDAAARLGEALFIEYWGEPVPTERRISEWLKRADRLAVGWKPSKELFRTRPPAR